jgi:hypothetical protein
LIQELSPPGRVNWNKALRLFDFVDDHTNEGSRRRFLLATPAHFGCGPEFFEIGSVSPLASDAILPLTFGVRHDTMAPKKHTVKFTATEIVKKPTGVKFETKEGPVKFTAKKPVEVKKKVVFKAGPKKK